jgi:hypothetical protein
MKLPGVFASVRHTTLAGTSGRFASNIRHGYPQSLSPPAGRLLTMKRHLRDRPGDANGHQDNSQHADAEGHRMVTRTAE